MLRGVSENNFSELSKLLIIASIIHAYVDIMTRVKTIFYSFDLVQRYFEHCCNYKKWKN